MKRLAVIILALTLSSAVSSARAVQAAASPGGFAVTSISIYFENLRPEITVSRTNTNVRATAEIATTGSGVLEGYWEMDGRVVGKVSQHVVGVGGTNLTPLKSPVLPTGTPGSHIIRFVVSGPAPAAPSALLFVSEEASGEIWDMALLQPSDDAEISFAPTTFIWDGKRDDNTYLISYFRSAKGKPIFAALTQKTSYTLPEIALKKNFRPGRMYFWRVTCIDSSGHTLCKSNRRGFRFKK